MNTKFVNSDEDYGYISPFKKDFDIYLQNVIDKFDDDFYFNNKDTIISDKFTAFARKLFYRGASEVEAFNLLESRIKERSL